MALILETGAGLPNANSYADLSTADAYWLDRANTVWPAATTTSREAALIRATDYVDATYVFRSVRAVDDQALESPRYGQTELHPAVVRAVIELALVLLSSDPFAPQTTRDVIEQTEILEGVGEVTTVYDPARKLTDPFPLITRMLASVASKRGASAGTIRLTL